MTKATQHRRFGNVRQLASGRWQARWKGPDGHTHTAPVTFASSDEADVWLAQQTVDRAGGRWVDERAGALTVTALAEQWKAERVHTRPSTRARDLTYWRLYLEPRFGARPVGSITAAEVAAWVSELRATELAPATVVKACQILGTILDIAKRDHRVVDNVARGLTLPKVELPELQVLTPAMVGRLADTIDPRYRALVIVGCYTGLRIGELFALTAGDVDLLRRRLTVTRNVTEVDGRLCHGTPKTAAGRRTVPLSAEAVAALTPLVGGAYHRDDLIFTRPDGGYLRRTNFQHRFWLPAVAEAGLAGFRCHDMRHTAISLWIAAGADPKAVATWAGHRSVSTVYDRYGHLMPDHAETFLARLDAMVVANS